MLLAGAGKPVVVFRLIPCPLVLDRAALNFGSRLESSWGRMEAVVRWRRVRTVVRKVRRILGVWVGV